MSKILEVLNRKSVELKSEKIEFAILDSTEKYIGQIYNDLGRAKVTLNGAGNQAEDISKGALLKIETGEENVAKAEAMAKELGVDIPEIKDLKSRLARAKKLGKELQSKGKAAQM